MSSPVGANNTTKILTTLKVDPVASSTGQYQVNERNTEHLANQTTISNLIENALTELGQASNEALQAILHQSSGRNVTDSDLTLSSSGHILATTLGNVTTMDATSNLTGQIVANMSGQGNVTSTSEPWFEMPPMENFTDFVSILSSGAVIIGGLVPYIPQYLKIKKSGSSEGFSTYVCLTLLIANLLRIAFWFGHRFELPLLVQSFVMIAGMLAMMELCVRARARSGPYIIGARPPVSRSRRSIIGKIFAVNSDPDDIPRANGLNNESTPIYSVNEAASKTSSPSSTSTANFVTSASASAENEPANSELPANSYHLQESIQIEHESLGHAMQHVEASPQYDSNRIDSLSDLESPILSNIQQPLAPQHAQAPLNGTESPLDQHSYSNGYISHQRKYRANLAKSMGSGNFWDWDDLLSYFKFLTLFTVILASITYLLLDIYLYVEMLGFAALFTESMLGVPQLVRNYVHKSTRGMSVEMVIMWLSGDLFKTLYFILRKTPVQFIVCGTIQVTVDVLILIQVFWYARPKVTYSKLPKST